MLIYLCRFFLRGSSRPYSVRFFSIQCSGFYFLGLNMADVCFFFLFSYDQPADISTNLHNKVTKGEIWRLTTIEVWGIG
jgi:hypothetical protein